MTRVRTLSESGGKTYASYTQETNQTSAPCNTNPPFTRALTNIPVGDVENFSISTYMEDVVTPNYKKLSAMGRVINSPMQKITSLVEEPVVDFAQYYEVWTPCTGMSKKLKSTILLEGTSTYAKRSYPLNAAAKYLPLVDFTPEEIQAGKDIATTEAWANINHADVLGLTILAESGKTVVGLTGLLKKVLRVIIKLRRKQFKLLWKEMKETKEYFDLYMQARYELRPLYYDTVGLMKAAKKLSPKIGSRETFRGNYNDSKKTEVTTDYYGPTSYLNCKFPCQRINTTTTNVKYRAGVLTQFQGSPHNLSLGATHIAESLWELVPFSFIVDWFANCGDVIASWTPNAESKVLASWVTVTTTEIQTSELIALEPEYTTALPTAMEVRNASNDLHAVHKRTTITKERFPNPSRSKLPHIEINLDPLKLLDLGIIIKNLKKASAEIRIPKQRRFAYAKIPNWLKIVR